LEGEAVVVEELEATLEATLEAALKAVFEVVARTVVDVVSAELEVEVANVLVGVEDGAAAEAVGP
jgi:hypothetical protein